MAAARHTTRLLAWFNQMRYGAVIRTFLATLFWPRMWENSPDRATHWRQDALKSSFRFIRTEEDDACVENADVSPPPACLPVHRRLLTAYCRRTPPVTAEAFLVRIFREGTWEQRIARKYYDKLFKARFCPAVMSAFSSTDNLVAAQRDALRQTASPAGVRHLRPEPVQGAEDRSALENGEGGAGCLARGKRRCAQDTLI